MSSDKAVFARRLADHLFKSWSSAKNRQPSAWALHDRTPLGPNDSFDHRGRWGRAEKALGLESNSHFNSGVLGFYPSKISSHDRSFTRFFRWSAEVKEGHHADQWWQHFELIFINVCNSVRFYRSNKGPSLLHHIAIGWLPLVRSIRQTSKKDLAC